MQYPRDPCMVINVYITINIPYMDPMGYVNPPYKKMTPKTPGVVAAFNVKILKCFDPCLLGTKTFQPLTSIPISTHSMSGSCRRSFCKWDSMLQFRGKRTAGTGKYPGKGETSTQTTSFGGGSKRDFLGGSPRWSFFGGNLGLFWRLNSLLVLGSVLLPAQKIRKIPTKVNQATSPWKINHLGENMWFFDGN